MANIGVPARLGHGHPRHPSSMLLHYAMHGGMVEELIDADNRIPFEAEDNQDVEGEVDVETRYADAVSTAAGATKAMSKRMKLVASLEPALAMLDVIDAPDGVRAAFRSFVQKVNKLLIAAKTTKQSTVVDLFRAQPAASTISLLPIFIVLGLIVSYYCITSIFH